MKPLPLLMPVVVSMTLISCEHKDLCIHDLQGNSGRLVIEAEYDLNFPFDYSTYTSKDNQYLQLDLPEGLRALVYSLDIDYDLHNLPAEGGEISINEGFHSILCYNNDTECIVFENLSSYSEAMASTSQISSGGYYLSARNEPVVNNPDMLFCGSIDSYYKQTLTTTEILPVKMQPRVFPYIIIVQFDAGYEYVTQAKGALSGMASKINLRTGETPDETATFTFDCTKESYGLFAVMNSFGTPNYQTDNNPDYNYEYYLTIKVRLTDGSYLTFEYDVSDQLYDQPKGGVISIDGLQITEPDPANQQAHSSGFDIDIDDWGESEEHGMIL
jgi:hypothetical protein